MFSGILPRLTCRRVTSNPNFSCVLKARFLSNSSRTELSNDVQKLRTIKRIATGLLFAGTLTTVIFVKKTRARKLKALLEDCQRLPVDENFAQGVEFFRYKGYVFPGELIKSGALKQAVQSFEAKPSDVYVVSFPKSGTTWLQEIVYLIETNLDFKSASARVLESRFPYLEYPYPGLKTIENQPEPRLIKTHLAFDLLPVSVKDCGAKIIYIMRNPKDVAVSFYHFLRMLKLVSYRGTWDEYLSKFCHDQVPYTPYFGHVLSYWAQRDDPNVLLLRYEDLHNDLEGSIRQIAQFLGKLLSEEQVRLIAQHVSFHKMARNPTVNYSHWDDLGLRNKEESVFMRKGQVGDWKNYFSPKQREEFHQWMASRLENTGLSFPED